MHDRSHRDVDSGDLDAGPASCTLQPALTLPDRDDAARDRYWLARCDGYVVLRGRESFGTVADVQRIAGAPVGLVVRHGDELSRIPASDVERVVPSTRRVYLRPAAVTAARVPR